MRRRPERFSLGILMASIGLLCVGLGLMRNGSATASQVAFSVTLFALLVGLLGALLRRGEGQWTGFALFGWAYFAMTSVPVMEVTFGNRLMAKHPLEALVERLNDVPPEPPVLPFSQATNSSGNEDGKMVGGQWVPMSPDEARVYKNYLTQTNAHWSSYNGSLVKIEQSRQIGHSLLTLLFALAGAALGRELTVRRTQAEASGS